MILARDIADVNMMIIKMNYIYHNLIWGDYIGKDSNLLTLPNLKMCIKINI